MPLKSVQAIAGHRVCSTLANRYTHAGVREAEAALAKMSELSALAATGTDSVDNRAEKGLMGWRGSLQGGPGATEFSHPRYSRGWPIARCFRCI